MKQQQGAALIVVLSLLAMALMLGLSSVQSSLIDERLAGNYRALALAQMAAEYEGANRLKDPNDPVPGGVSCAGAEEHSESTRSSDWTTGDLTGIGNETLGARYIACRDGLTDVNVFLVEGYVKTDSMPLASYFLRVGRTRRIWADFNLGDDLREALGDSVMLTDLFRQGDDVTYSGNIGNGTRPDPRDLVQAIGSRTGDADVVEDCTLSQDPSFYANADYVYCSGSISGDIDDRVDGKVILSTGSMTLEAVTDVNAALVSSDDLFLEGFGKTITGVLWTLDELRFKDVQGDNIDLKIRGALIGAEIDADDKDGDVYRIDIAGATSDTSTSDPDDTTTQPRYIVWR